jgi:hypothetical protein
LSYGSPDGGHTLVSGVVTSRRPEVPGRTEVATYLPVAFGRRAREVTQLQLGAIEV